MSFELNFQFNVFDDVRHKFCIQPKHCDIFFSPWRMEPTNLPINGMNLKEG